MIEKNAATKDSESKPVREEKVIYVAPLGDDNEWGDDFNLRELFNEIWRGRVFVALITLLVTATGTIYALLAAEWYRAEVLLMPAVANSMQGMPTQFGSLASLAGLKIGGENNAEALATLRSNGFSRDFLRDANLTETILIAKRNPIKGLNRDAGVDPDIREATEYFGSRILSVSEDRKTGIVTLAVQWRDPKVAAAWANKLVERLNDQMRSRALKEASVNISYLRSTLGSTSTVTLQNSIGRLLELELQRAMLAKGNREFSYRVIDKAIAPRERTWPKRALVVALSFAVGIAVSMAILAVRHGMISRGKPVS